MPALPPPVADERDGLLTFLAQQRYTLEVTSYGLTDDQARATPSASSLSVGGLIKHVTFTERQWMGHVVSRERESDPAAYDENFRLREDETLADVVADYHRAAEETAAVIASIDDLGHPVPVPPAPWFPKDVAAWSVRWVLLHLIEETARHAGHADIIRETLDGATLFSLLAGREGWPASPWITPWQPAGSGDG